MIEASRQLPGDNRMTSLKHTSGPLPTLETIKHPWDIEHRVRTTSGRLVATVEGEDEHEAARLATLFAAAPDLLAATVIARHYIKDFAARYPRSTDAPDALKLVDRAIAKATGA